MARGLNTSGVSLRHHRAAVLAATTYKRQDFSAGLAAREKSENILRARQTTHRPLSLS